MKKEEPNKIVVIVKLGLWLAFIAVLMIFSRFGESNKNTNIKNSQNEIEKEVIPYEEKLEGLINNYSYIYEIKIDNDIYIYSGSKMIDGIYIKESGDVKKNNEVLFKYFLENGYSYQVNNGGLDKIDSIYDSKIDANYLDVDKIKNMINNREYVVENENKYIYNLEDKKIIIVIDEDSISNIEVIIGENYYKMKISEIGTVKNIKY